MKIGLFSDDFYPTVGGVESFVHRLATSMSTMGHDVVVVASEARDANDRFDYRVVRVPGVSLPWQENPVALPTRRAAKRLSELEFDVVHTHTESTIGSLGHRVARLSSIPHLHSTHTNLTVFVDQYSRIFSWTGLAVFGIIRQLTTPDISTAARRMPATSASRLEDQVWRFIIAFASSADRVICPSAHWAKSLVDHGLDREPDIIPCGVSVAGFGAASSRDALPAAVAKLPTDVPIVVSVGRISPEKRVDMIIRGFTRVADQTAPAVLTLVGDGPAMADCRQLARSLGIAPRVIFLGTCDSRAVAAVLARSSLFVLGSYNFDICPAVAIEAMASSLPIVYCDANLFPGALSPANSLLCDASDAGLAHGIVQLVRDKCLREEMGRQSLVVSRGFDIAKTAEDTIARYQSMVMTHRRSVMARQRQ